MIPASQRLYDAIIERRLVHPNDPRLNAHVAAAVAVMGAEAGGSTRRTEPTISTRWSRWRWRSIASRTGRSRPGSWAGCEATLPRVRGAGRWLLLPRARAMAPTWTAQQ